MTAIEFIRNLIANADALAKKSTPSRPDGKMVVYSCEIIRLDEITCRRFSEPLERAGESMTQYSFRINGTEATLTEVHDLLVLQLDA